jgi:hypothetical protein
MERHPRGKMRGGFAEHHRAPEFGGSEETSKSTPVAGHTTGGGVSFGQAEHHMKSGEGKDMVGHTAQQTGHGGKKAEHHRNTTFGGETHRFRGTHGGSVLRHSGHSGAHQIGCKR